MPTIPVMRSTVVRQMARCPGQAPLIAKVDPDPTKAQTYGTWFHAAAANLLGGVTQDQRLPIPRGMEMRGLKELGELAAWWTKAKSAYPGARFEQRLQRTWGGRLGIDTTADMVWDGGVVDWKTGNNHDRLQLSIYRWAAGLPETTELEFVHVNNRVRVFRVLSHSDAELAHLFRQALSAVDRPDHYEPNEGCGVCSVWRECPIPPADKPEHYLFSRVE